MRPLTMTDALFYSSINKLSKQIKERIVSPVDVVKTCLSRIETLNPALNAFITVLKDQALERAATAVSQVNAGSWQGPLHGIPIGVKDFYDTAGVKTTAAFEHFRDRVPMKDAVGVAKLKKAGAIIIGKTNMHTLGMGTTGLESCFGPTHNPWNDEYIAGGSSSGSAAAVASGLCYATFDTDAIGSCRLPAACCGVVGFKGTYGLVSSQGILEGEAGADETILWLGHPGITTRSVVDTALMLDVLAERMPGTQPFSFSSGLGKMGPLEIGVADNLEVDRDVAAAFEESVETIRSFGHRMKKTSVPFSDPGRGIRDIETDRKTIGEHVFKEIDLLLLPTTTSTVPAVKDAIRSPQALSPRNTMFANYYGLPAISVPCGFDEKGLPLGLQIVGKPWGDETVLRLANEFDAYRAAKEYGSKHPKG
jgi:aspartyl-tRNA(Asn)/glutamyl-tRNA(Gln) amidotransferase subunit A